MPRKGITAYDLLISCPGDVSSYVDVIRECVDGFNRVIGAVNNSEVVTKHWSTDSYSQSGDKPQELLNKQFVRECDAAVAVFWTRFGTPTDKYGSGTEEEIEEMLSDNKQVFMYFVDAPIELSTVDVEQYKKVCDFKEKYKDRGLYFVVKSEEELRQLFTNHLSMHFLPIFMGEKHTIVEKKEVPVLSIKDATSEGGKVLNVFTSDYSQCKFILDKANKIREQIIDLKKDYLPERDDEEKKEVASSILDTQKLIKSAGFLNDSSINVEISEKHKEEIIKFADNIGSNIPLEFWNVGNLKKSALQLNTMFGGGTTYYGSDKEKQRYKQIEDLYWSIKEYKEYLSYFEAIDKNAFVELIVSNSGTSYDEDIDIKLLMDKNHLLKKQDIPVPEINIIEELLEIHFLRIAYVSKKNDAISEYTGYPLTRPRFDYNTNPLLQYSVREKYEQNIENYKDEINEIFCYEYYQKEGKDIITFHIDYLKHNTKIFFPSLLCFSSMPSEIEYEITSKFIPNVVKGCLKIENNE